MRSSVTAGSLGEAVEEPPLVELAVRAALAARAVVGDHDDDRVVELARLLEVVEDPAEAVVPVGDVAGEDLGHAREQPLLVGAQRVPRPHGVERGPRLAVGTRALRLAVRVDRRELGAFGQQPQLDLAREDAGADRLVALVEPALVLVGPLQRHLVRRVAGLRREVHEERLVGVDHLRVADELDRLVREVVGDVVAVLGPARRVDLVVVVDEVGIPVVRLAAEPAVEALEPAPERPPALERGEVALLARRQVPLADAVRVVPVLGEHLGDEAVLERDARRDPREARRELGDRRHAVARRVATGQQRRARRRAQRGRVEVRELHAAIGDAPHVRGLDRAAEHVHRPVADVVPREEQHVRRTLAARAARGTAPSRASSPGCRARSCP